MENLIALALATLVLVSIPGPNAALIVANSLKYGVSSGLVTVLGTTTGVALQLLLVVLGMAAVVEFAADTLGWIRWAGVVYLVWLGVRTWREAPADLDAVMPSHTVFWRGCGLAAVNPKTLLFNAAFLPQFLPMGTASTGDAVLVAATFLLLLLLGDMLWAVFAGIARPILGRYVMLRNRVTGGFLVVAGAALALSRRSI